MLKVPVAWTTRLPPILLLSVIALSRLRRSAAISPA